MAGVTARRRGAYWEYRFDMASEGGRRKQCSKGGFRTKGEAMKAGTKALAEYGRAGIVASFSAMSMHDWLSIWANGYVAHNLSPRTRETYASIVRKHIEPAFGRYRVASITPVNVNAFAERLSDEGLTRGNIRVVLSVLSGAFQRAVEGGIMPSNPAKGVRVPLGARKSMRRDAITEEQFRAILERTDPTYAVCFHIAWHTGMRESEVLGLSWDDVDFSRGLIHVRRKILKHGGKYYVSEPKYGSVRTITMGKALASILKEERARQLGNEMRYGEFYRMQELRGDMVVETAKRDAREPFRLVCLQENGSMVKADSLRCMVIRTRGKVGFFYDFHTLRHTHATRLLEAGASPVAVQHRLGHKSSKVTMDIYAHMTHRMEDDLSTTLDHMEKIPWTNCGQNGRNRG